MLKKSKIVYVLLDGVGDLPHPDLNGLTPLEAAQTPFMDKISRKGVSGLVTSVGDGIAPQSDIAVFNMLGYNFRDVEYFGRGVVECIGCGIDFLEGDLALRGNFATINPSNKKIIDRRAGRVITREESKKVCDLIRKNLKLPGIEFEVEPTVGHRVVLRFRKNCIRLGQNITNTDPAYDKVNGIGIALDTNNKDIFVASSLPKDDPSQESSKIVNEFSNQVISILDRCQVNIERTNKGLLPINCILMRDSGNQYPKVDKINEKYGLNFASLVDMPVEIGISKIIGMKSYEAGEPGDYDLKARNLTNIIEHHDLVYVHIKGPDEFGHDGDAMGKKRNIEQIDLRFFKRLYEELIQKPVDYDVGFVISGDHSTPCIKKAHTDDPIPLVISGLFSQNDGTSRFTEKQASKGSIGKIYGSEVIEHALKILNKN
jgi:2,3-bisphosphoglycerate-independent phosphoglycerate mutase